ncbi:MAG: glycosyltransferase family A protein [Balneolaceae bacterium]
MVLQDSLVSIVIPTYNRKNLFIRALDSAVNQTYSNIEIIVVDDASAEDLSSLLTQYGNIKFFRNEENRGPCFSRNRGLMEASGEYINFLDDDDVLFPTKIERQLQCFEETNYNNLGMVTCNLIDERSGDAEIVFNRVQGNIYKELLSSYCVSGTETMLFKTKVVKEVNGFDENLDSSQEYDLLIRISQHYEVDYVNKVLTKKYRSFNQISQNFDKKISGAIYLYKKHNYRFKDEGWPFWLKMQVKLKLLLFRFYMGKYFGEKVYKMLMIK